MEKLSDVLVAHRYEQYDLRSGCKCGWGTTLCSKSEGYAQWAEHVTERMGKKDQSNFALPPGRKE